jgi:hypothetical protein
MGGVDVEGLGWRRADEPRGAFGTGMCPKPGIVPVSLIPTRGLSATTGPHDPGRRHSSSSMLLRASVPAPATAPASVHARDLLLHRLRAEAVHAAVRRKRAMMPPLCSGLIDPEEGGGCEADGGHEGECASIFAGRCGASP